MEELLNQLRIAANANHGLVVRGAAIAHNSVEAANWIIEREFDDCLDQNNSVRNDEYDLHLDPIGLETAAGWLNFFQRTGPHVADLDEAIHRALWEATTTLADANACICYLVDRYEYDLNALSEEAQDDLRAAVLEHDQRSTLSASGGCWVAVFIRFFGVELPAQPQDPPPQGPPLRPAFYQSGFIAGVYDGQLEASSVHYQRFSKNIYSFESNGAQHRWHPNAFDRNGMPAIPSDLDVVRVCESLIELGRSGVVPDWIVNAAIRYVEGGNHCIRIQEIPEDFIWNAPPSFILSDLRNQSDSYIFSAVSDLIDEVRHLGVLGALLRFVGHDFARQARSAPCLAFAFIHFSDELRYSGNICENPLLLAASNLQQIQTRQIHDPYYNILNGLWGVNTAHFGSFVSFRAWINIAPFSVNLNAVDGLYQPGNNQ